MPSRKVVAKELGGLLKLLSHPDRILILHLLSVAGGHSVTSIAEELELTPTRVSQHLAQMRIYRLVDEKSVGRKRIYTLAVERLPHWLLDGVDFVAGRVGEVTRAQAEEAKRLWEEGSHFPHDS